jgi:UDP-hydrolysing UDP-N-acetyl-D-glucosamine 2-epimerase
MKYIVQALLSDPDFKTIVVVGGAAVSDTYGNILPDLERDGIPVQYTLPIIVEGGSPSAMAKTTALGLLEFSTVFSSCKPDIVLLRGDRFEMMAPVIAAAYMNITVAHIEGGDVSGTIDNSVRHAITKLSHLHLTTNEESYSRVIQMGEPAQTVYNVGSPDIEFIERNRAHIDVLPTHITRDDYLVGGIGAPLDLTKSYLVALQHPVTTEYGQGKEHMRAFLDGLVAVGMPVMFFWPNMDAGTDEMSKTVRQFINNEKPKNFYFLKNIPPEDFLALVNHASCLVGNSSTGIKECSYLGTPVVNVGTRQSGRLRGNNVLDAPYDAEQIAQAIRAQLKAGKYAPQAVYGLGETSAQVLAVLKTAPLEAQKRMSY